ncbi:hypothetical protein K435DRAFT_814689 [Dendrothele bispora CBS 962.96]|uniref:Uncharacterized protein n=1 Tax=Dendrothele bispora (strain CBS 962.96) TaxID=1314807 RepID=A0A4S8MXQ1_DENBC|nr:hypothetical protein K435DRAFT_814689 [Dendrothele bispora CBS 962.96]
MSSYASIPSISSSHLNPPAAAQSNRVTFADGYNTSASPLDLHAELSPGPSRRTNRRNLGILKSPPIEDTNSSRRTKRTFDGYDQRDDGDNVKKTRVEGDEFIDGDEEAEWQYDSQPSHEQSRAFAKASKRGLADDYDDDSDIAVSKRQREKRARKVSADKSVDMDDIDEDMVVDEEDYGDYARTFSRGRKRDRAEAASSMGGDEENEDPEDIEEEIKLRGRKRRNQRKSDVAPSHSRGSKRHRDVEDEAGAEDSDDMRDQRWQGQKDWGGVGK